MMDLLEDFFPSLAEDGTVCTGIVTAANGSRVYYTEVAVIGNGPCAISLSTLLSGCRPFYDIAHPHPSLEVHEKLVENVDKCLLEHDLAELSSGLQGRTNNPVSLLYDELVRPDADIGHDHDSCIRWETGGVAVPHIVLGRGSAGGSWQGFPDGIQTLSYASWLDLPGFSYADYKRKKNKYRDQSMVEDFEFWRNAPSRAGSKGIRRKSMTPPWELSSSALMAENKSGGYERPYYSDVQNYFETHVTEMGISGHFLDYCEVTSICPVLDCRSSGSPSVDGFLQSNVNNLPIKFVWEIKGMHAGAGSFVIRAAQLVLATGTPIPRAVGIPGEEEQPSWVFHTVHDLENAVDSSFLRPHFSLDSSSSAGSSRASSRRGSGNSVTSMINFETYPAEFRVAVGRSLSYEDAKLLPTTPRSTVPGPEPEPPPVWDRPPVLVVGAGLSAADAIAFLLTHQIPVIHVFRKGSRDPQNMLARLSNSSAYPEYAYMAALLKGRRQTLVEQPNYRRIPGHKLARVWTESASSSSEISIPERHFVAINPFTLGNKNGTLSDTQQKVLEVSFVTILVGFEADLSYLPPKLAAAIVQDRSRPVDGKSNPLGIDALTGRIRVNCDNRMPRENLLRLWEQYLYNNHHRRKLHDDTGFVPSAVGKDVGGDEIGINICDDCSSDACARGELSASPGKSDPDNDNDCEQLRINCDCIPSSSSASSPANSPSSPMIPCCDHESCGNHSPISFDSASPVKSDIDESDKTSVDNNYCDRNSALPSVVAAEEASTGDNNLVIDGLYALGPLIGDNFVRYGVGGAFTVGADVVKKYNRYPTHGRTEKCSVEKVGKKWGGLNEGLLLKNCCVGGKMKCCLVGD